MRLVVTPDPPVKQSSCHTDRSVTPARASAPGDPRHPIEKIAELRSSTATSALTERRSTGPRDKVDDYAAMHSHVEDSGVALAINSDTSEDEDYEGSSLATSGPSLAGARSLLSREVGSRFRQDATLT